MSAGTSSNPRGRLTSWWPLLVLAVLAYLPLLLTHRGWVAADTRQAALVDPARYLSRAWSLWDDNVHLGTVTHQNVGLIFPFGTWFWVLERLGAPLWVAQRLWLGTILFAAGAGVRYLVRGRGWGTPATVVAAVSFMLSPYVLQYANRTSVLLLPFAGLPWLIGAFDRAARSAEAPGRWRHPALAALVCLTVGGGNATALLFMVVGGALWLVVAAAIGESSWRATLKASARCALLIGATSAWGVAVLAVQGRYGLDVLSYTESLGSVSTTNASHEVLRGLGYWIFYGLEGNQPNVAAAPAYLQNPVLLALSFGLAGLSLLAAATVRYRERAFVLLAIVLGVVVATATYPFTGPGPVGTAIRDGADTSRIALALRSATRIVPLVVLGLSLALGAGVAALAQWWHERRDRSVHSLAPAFAAATVVLLVLNQPAVFTGDRVDRNYERPEQIPAWWTDSARALGSSRDTRVLEIPGQPFTSYRWGTTYEPVLPGLTDRPVVAREQLPYGSAPSADLLSALDRRIQEGVFEPDSLAPTARLLGAGDVLVRSDLRYERYLTARPRRLWQLLSPTPAGLRDPAAYGDPAPNVAEPFQPLVDEQDLLDLGATGDPPRVAVFAVDDPHPIVSVQPVSGTMVIAGDGEGLVDAAAAGVITGDELLRPAAAMDDAELSEASAAGTPVVVTDSNRRRTRRWRSTKANVGQTLRADQEVALDQQGDAPLVVFPDETSDDQTVAEQIGGTVDSSSYGGPFFVLDPDDRAVGAFDGDPATDWSVGPAISGVGEWIQLTLDAPTSSESLTLLQRQATPNFTSITSVRLTFDGDTGRSLDVALDDTSIAGDGQVVSIPAEPFTTLRIEITGTSRLAAFAAFPDSQHGFAEIGIPGVAVREVLRMPTRPLGALPSSTPLDLLMSRSRSDPADVSRRDEERGLARSFTLSTARTFTSVTGTARVSSRAARPQIDAVLTPGADVVATGSSGVLPGSLISRPAAMLDDDPTTAWQSPFDAAQGAWVEVDLAAAAPVDALHLELVTDGRHSVPRTITVSIDGREQSLVLPDFPAVSASGRTAVDVAIAPDAGTDLRITVDSIEPLTIPEYYAGGLRTFPVGIAAWRIADLPAQHPEPQIDTGCRGDLLEVDGVPLDVRITGSASEAAGGGGLSVDTCAPVTLAEGRHEVRAVPGALSGIDLDRLLWSSPGTSDAVGTAVPARRAGVAGAAGSASDSTPVTVDVERRSATELRVTVGPVAEASWLVLGESFSDGWRASGEGLATSSPELVDGFANGWALSPSGQPRTFTLEWMPQRIVSWTLLGSGAAGVVCVGLVLGIRRRAPVLAGFAPVFDAGGARRSSTRRRLVWTTVWLILGAAVVGPVGGVAVAAAALVVRTWPRSLAAWRAVGLGLVAAGVGWVTIAQVRSPRAPGYGWTTAVTRSHWLVLGGLLLLVAVEPFGSRLPPPGERRPSTAAPPTTGKSGRR